MNEISVFEMADAIAYELGKDGIWKAVSNGLGEIALENENGDRFKITVESEG